MQLLDQVGEKRKKLDEEANLWDMCIWFTKNRWLRCCKDYW
jgi:hypothetical protein